jgi:hypothetical protein
MFSKYSIKGFASHVPFSFWIGKGKVKFFIVVLPPKDS